MAKLKPIDSPVLVSILLGAIGMGTIQLKITEDDILTTYMVNKKQPCYCTELVKMRMINDRNKWVCWDMAQDLRIK